MGTPACLITVVVVVVELVGRDGLWWRIRGDGAVLVVTDFIFRSSPRWATAVGLRVVEEESFTVMGNKPTTVVAEVVEEAGGPVRPPSMARPARPTQVEVEEAAGIKFRVSPEAPVSW
jgi:hypothetical protein